MLKLNREQAEVVYNSLLQTLRASNIEFDSKHEQLQDVITNRHDVTDVLDQLDSFYEFIVSENDINFDDYDDKETLDELEVEMNKYKIGTPQHKYYYLKIKKLKNK